MYMVYGVCKCPCCYIEGLLLFQTLGVCMLSMALVHSRDGFKHVVHKNSSNSDTTSKELTSLFLRIAPRMDDNCVSGDQALV